MSLIIFKWEQESKGKPAYQGMGVCGWGKLISRELGFLWWKGGIKQQGELWNLRGDFHTSSFVYFLEH